MASSSAAQAKSDGSTSAYLHPALIEHEKPESSITASQSDKEVPKEATYSLIDDLSEGCESALKVLVCRKWDATNVFGKYISTEYIVSDEKGNAIHCIARSNISHCFLSKLEEGNVYLLRDFTVKPNKDSYRIRNNDSHMIHLEGNTVVKKIECNHDGFQPHPYEVIRIEDINSNGNKFLIDVIGCVTNVSTVKVSKTGTKYLDCQLTNERGARIRLTLWGSICDVLVDHAGHVGGLYAALFPCMNVKEFRGEVYLSSTSATAIVDGHHIPQINSFRSLIKDSVPQGDYTPPDEVSGKEASLLELIHMGREQRATRGKSTTLRCKVKITNIRARNSWYYFSCGIGKCKKGVTRAGGKFWCDSCAQICEFPLTRYRLHMDVIDASAGTVVTAFDGVVEKMVTRKADDLLEEVGDTPDESILPPELHRLLDTCHVLELKTHTYYDHGNYESFTCSNVLSSSTSIEVMSDKLISHPDEALEKASLKRRRTEPADSQPVTPHDSQTSAFEGATA